MKVEFPSIVAQKGAGLGWSQGTLALTQGQAGRQADSPTTFTHTEFDITGRPHLRATCGMSINK